MKIKCDYCGQMIDEGLDRCPNCGASISAVNRMASGEPKTIEELKQWYVAHNLPPEETTRFFIGKDIKEPKAFGIYKNSKGDFVVYKNKASGERTVRYEGSDEGYAVNELYQRLRAEIADQKEHSRGRSRSSSGYSCNLNRSSRTSSDVSIFLVIFTVVLIIIISSVVAIFDKSPNEGYYRYKGNDYYYQDNDWYIYDLATDSWDSVWDESELNSTINSDTYRDYRIYDHDGSQFEDSSWYDAGSDDDDSDWDSDSSWDSDWDDWDSGGTDWDSDW
ncbi:hypothetical protein SAMN04487829_2120 [Pseudobutyrivibrio sp. NOR37]|uniref:Uncharacterized protein n=1 Tax=Pseudobutyrivibrio xylanivorans TaxID=185007 RepID=A0A6M0LJA3_PSEXY|nr:MULTISPECIES: zinc ribbon domain-containing protein [Pseudobutyrivibrio]NEX02658.1 hypothetical protein [Pseudobutyrivibrio xylanivorans]SFR80145.1 hypothetical protein SAMN04487829_2120 [Pseudobutyrivibrio sp. NOR37]